MEEAWLVTITTVRYWDTPSAAEQENAVRC